MRRQAAVIVVLLLGLLLVTPSASPLRIGYVTSDSMAPTLEPSDGYVAVPPGDVEAGDVVVFWSSLRGEYVTHRVVDQTDAGLVTKGDGNQQTDQESGYPPVQRSAVVAKVVTVGGGPLVLPGVGTVIPAIQRYRSLLFGAMLAAALLLLVRVRARWRQKRPGRTVLRIRDVVEPLLLVGLVTFVAVTPLGAATYQLTYVATADGSGQYSIPIDEAATRNVSIHATDTPFTTRVVRAEGMTVVDREANGSSIDLTVSIPPPGSAGPRDTAIRVYPYPSVAPQSVIERLHDVHPAVAILGTSGTLFGALYLLYRLSLDPDRPIFTSRSHWAEHLGGS